jgi:hypothetical protein
MTESGDPDALESAAADMAAAAAALVAVERSILELAQGGAADATTLESKQVGLAG